MYALHDLDHVCRVESVGGGGVWWYIVAGVDPAGDPAGDRAGDPAVVSAESAPLQGQGQPAPTTRGVRDDVEDNII